MPRRSVFFVSLLLAALLALPACGPASHETRPAKEDILRKFKPSYGQCREEPDPSPSAGTAMDDAGPCL